MLQTTQSPGEPSIDGRKVIAFIAMIFGMFMAILDIQIVSSSLAEIQAGLSASSEEASWIQTSYLIAEVIMIPLSGFLGRLLSTRVLFSLSATGFTIASILCATATSINEMIIYRAIQGFIGGAMIPSVFTAAFTIFPPSKRSIVSPLVGLIATIAPTIGPTVGGYLSHDFSWHWLFLINVPFGVAVAILSWKFIDFDKANHTLFKKFDWWGLLGMGACLGSLEYILEEGPRHEWLQDTSIFVCSIIMILGGLLFFWRATTAAEPIADISAFRNKNFALGCTFSFVLGIGLYGLTYLYPIFLGSIRGYDSLMIGETMFLSGLSMFISAPLAGILSTRLDARLMMLLGFIGFAIGTWMPISITSEWDFWELFWPQIFRGFSIMLCMVPINNIALGTLPLDQVQKASGLFNLTRNLGGAVGLAAISSILTKRGDFHYARLAESISWNNTQAQGLLETLSHSLNIGLESQGVALMQLYGMTRQQASVMAFSDAFLLLTFIFLGLSLLIFVLEKPPKSVGNSDIIGH
ncbi:DHA2 family efflux MFS transporter permease subunit [Bartonella sp. DGB2]|uniref:DHA2 family efflux MFS transporter permease subunit n=1 Tax=Bartonella sp. DGB2 TaxID=3388426 RepID=UPI00398FD528